MRTLLATVGLLVASVTTAAASPPLDLFDEGGPRVDVPSDLVINQGPTVGLSGVGDVNGDGLSDVAVSNVVNGAVHVLLGRTSLRSTPTVAMPPDDGFTITGPAGEHEFGLRLASAGDVNDDGYDDILIVDEFSPSTAADRNSAYVVFGSAAPHDVDVEQLGDQGFAITNIGHFPRVAGLGDMDGDGYDDIAVGTGGSSEDINSVFGVAVIYGGPDPQSLDARELGGRGFSVVPGERFGQVGDVDGAGDVNGDGRDDLVAGLPGSASEAQEGAVVVFGGPRRTEPIDVSNLGSDGFRVEFGAKSDLFQQTVAGLGDFNGDGLSDVALTLPGRRNLGQAENVPRPATYVIFGSASTETVHAQELGTRGLKLLTGSMGVHGIQVAGPGDVDGDGRMDLLVGVPGQYFRENDKAGRAFAVFGRDASGTVSLQALGGPGDSDVGFAMNGLSRDVAGHRVAGAGDMDGDSHPELAIMAAGCRGGRVAGSGVQLGNSGVAAEVYLVDILSRARGARFSTEGDDTLVVDGDEPRRTGRGGDDELIGNGSSNCLYGDSGRDTLAGHADDDVLFGNRDDDDIAGGEGRDFLHGGGGADRLDGQADPDYLAGAPGGDTLEGSGGTDWLEGKGGEDTLQGGEGGDEFLLGGTGDDTVTGGDGDDGVHGGRGADVLRGGAGSDGIAGANGDDKIDTVDGEVDQIYCGRGEDTVRADERDEIVVRRERQRCEHVTRV